MNYKWGVLSKLSCFKIVKLSTLFYKVFHGLSENHKIFKIE